jgi:thioredoxin reductase
MSDVIAKSQKPIVVIGAGPAGLIAARAAKEAGYDNVIIIDREKDAGGILNQCIHAGFGLIQFKQELTGPEYADKVFKMAINSGVEFKMSTSVLNIAEDKTITMISPSHGIETLQAAAIILCTGCRERARGVIHIPGERPAGIYCAGLAQKFVNIDGYLPGKRVVILGSGDIGLIMARRMTLQGAKVLAVVEAQSYVGGLSRNVVQCLQDFNIPLYLSHTVTNIKGKKRVESVTISRVSENFRPVAGTEFEIPCDTLLLSIGLIPENELAESCGVKLHHKTNGSLIDENYMTNVEGIFACGNALHVHDLVDHLAKESEMVGKNAVAYLQTEKSKSLLPIQHDAHFSYLLPHKVSGESDVRFQYRVSRPMDDVTLHVNGFTKKIKLLRPNMMNSVLIPKEYLKGEIKLWIEKN